MAADQDHNHDEPVIRDKRRIDPATGEVRKPEGADAESVPEGQAETADAAASASPEGDAGDEKELTVDDILNAAQAEVETQNQKFALMRNYDKAKQAFVDVKAQADKVRTQAIANKEAAKQEANTRLQEASAAIAAAREALTKAPKTKDTRADIQLFTSDIDGLDASISEVNTMISSEDYKGAAAAIGDLELHDPQRTPPFAQSSSRPTSSSHGNRPSSTFTWQSRAFVSCSVERPRK